jgi:hypothetical protein
LEDYFAMIFSMTIGHGTILRPLHIPDAFSAKSMFENGKRK